LTVLCILQQKEQIFRMNIDKNSRVSTRQVIPPDGENSGKSKTKNLNVNLNQGWSKKTKVRVWIDDDADNDSVGISVNLNKRHNTCPNINQASQYVSTLASTTGRNLSLPNSANTRKSFFGELKSLLTFNKKQDGLPPGESTTSFFQQEDPTTQGQIIVIEKEFDKENKKVALQNRRKQVFQKQDDAGEGSSTEEPPIGLAAVGTTVNKLQMSLKKWKIKKNTKVIRDTIAVNKHHQKMLDECADRLQTEIPFPLHIIMKEESLLIINRVYQMYTSMLGSKHKLTKETEKHIIYLQQSTYVPDYKPSA